MTPGAGPILTPGLLFEQTWVFLKEDILSFFYQLPWQPEFCMEFNSLNNF
jgi:hypothetical protein